MKINFPLWNPEHKPTYLGYVLNLYHRHGYGKADIRFMAYTSYSYEGRDCYTTKQLFDFQFQSNPVEKDIHNKLSDIQIKSFPVGQWYGKSIAMDCDAYIFPTVTQIAINLEKKLERITDKYDIFTEDELSHNLRVLQIAKVQQLVWGENGFIVLPLGKTIVE